MLEEPWRIRMLGCLQAEAGTKVIRRFRTQQAGALLARLALFPRRAQSREQLADLLWPDDSPQAARAKLRLALYSLRRQFEPPLTTPGSVFTAARLCIGLQPGAVQTDVGAFEEALRSAAAPAISPEDKRTHLQHALSLCVGELLPGFYDEWVLEERARLEALAEDAHATLAALLPAVSPPDARAGHTASAPAPPVAEPVTLVRLPLTLTRFFGRDPERGRLKTLLVQEKRRLVTLTGLGGTGKTRLAVEVARTLVPEFPRAVAMIDLSALTDAARLPFAIAEALGFAPDPDGDARDALVEALDGGPTLLVLDNLEQIAAGVAPVLSGLLTRLPQLCLLTTSRRTLGVAGEQVMALSPLPWPDPSASRPDDLLDCPAAQLFVDRAQAARPDFALTARNCQAVAELCAQLEGLPLALELAASWAGVLSPAQMRERYGPRHALAARGRGHIGRHRTLGTALDASWDLLPSILRRAWACLSVFRGGWTLEALVAVCPEAEGLETMARLRERSLLTAEEDADGMRFRMLETLREYGASRLEPVEAAEAFTRHARFFRALAEEASPHVYGPGQASWLHRLERERANFEAALVWCAGDASGDGGDADGLAFASALARFWMLRGPLKEGRRFLTAALARPGAQASTRQRAGALNGCGLIAWMEADYDYARACHEEALSIRRTLGDPRAVAASLGNLGLVAVELRDYDAARCLGEEALKLNQTAGDLRGQSIDLNNLGDVATHQERFEDARTLYERSAALCREHGDSAGEAISLGNLGLNAVVRGDFAQAVTFQQQTLRIRRESGDQWRMTFSLANLADALRGQGRWHLSALLYGAAQALRDRIDYVDAPVRRDQLAAELDALRAAYGPERFEAAYAQGRALPPDEAVDLALSAENP